MFQTGHTNLAVLRGFLNSENDLLNFSLNQQEVAVLKRSSY